MAAGFNAPISGVFFAVESVLQREPRDSETEARNSSGLTVAMVLLASVLAAIVSRAGLGDNPAFRVPAYQLQSLWEIPLVMVLGSACGLVSAGFSYCSEVGSFLSQRGQALHAIEDPLILLLIKALPPQTFSVVSALFGKLIMGNSNHEVWVYTTLCLSLRALTFFLKISLKNSLTTLAFLAGKWKAVQAAES